MEVNIRMHRRILQVLSDLDKKDFNLFGSPSQGSGEGTDGDRIETVVDDAPIIEANHLEVCVFRPWTNRHFLDLVADIDESSVV